MFESDIEQYGLASHFVTQWWLADYTWTEIKRLTHGAYLFCPDKATREELLFLYDIADIRYQAEINE